MQEKYIFSEQFWDTLKFIEKITDPTPLSELMDSCQLEKVEELEGIISFLNHFQFNCKIEEKGGEYFLIPPSLDHGVEFKLSFSEWLAFQAHFPKICESFSDEPFHEILIEKLSQVENKYPDLDLFKVLEKQKYIEGHFKEKNAELLHKLEEALQLGSTIEISLKENNIIHCFPHRLVFLDGGLSIIAEECEDGCLIYFRVEELLTTEIIDSGNYDYNFSSLEVNDFIFALRAVAGGEERLVLKIMSGNDVDLRPPYQFLGNPYITANPEGDMIWAASVEVCDELYSWLFEMHDKVEILDPANIKKDYENYCLAMSTELKNAA